MVHNFCLFCTQKKKKHIFSILHTHFYKTSSSVYLLYTLFYINNIFLFYFSLTLKLSASLFSLTHKLTTQYLPLPHPSKSLHLKSLISLLLRSLNSLTSFFSQFSLIQYPHSQIFSELALTLSPKLALLDLSHLISSVVPPLGLYLILILILGLGYGFSVDGLILS